MVTRTTRSIKDKKAQRRAAFTKTVLTMGSDDKRPRIYGSTATQDGAIEVTVQGAEGETTEDIAETFDEKVDKLIDSQDKLDDCDDEDDCKGVQ